MYTSTKAVQLATTTFQLQQFQRPKRNNKFMRHDAHTYICVVALSTCPCMCACVYQPGPNTLHCIDATTATSQPTAVLLWSTLPFRTFAALVVATAKILLLFAVVVVVVGFG